MDNPNVLRAAIAKLKMANQALRNKMRETASEEQMAIYHDQLIKNDAMILDYEFRLKTT